MPALIFLSTRFVADCNSQKLCILLADYTTDRVYKRTTNAPQHKQPIMSTFTAQIKRTCSTNIANSMQHAVSINAVWITDAAQIH